MGYVWCKLHFSYLNVDYNRPPMVKSAFKRRVIFLFLNHKITITLKFGDSIPIFFFLYYLNGNIFVSLSSFSVVQSHFGKITTPLLHLVDKMEAQISHETKSIDLIWEMALIWEVSLQDRLCTQHDDLLGLICAGGSTRPSCNAFT